MRGIGMPPKVKLQNMKEIMNEEIELDYIQRWDERRREYINRLLYGIHRSLFKCKSTLVNI